MKPFAFLRGLGEAVVGALCGPESHSVNRYEHVDPKIFTDEKKHDDEYTRGMDSIQRYLDSNQ